MRLFLAIDITDEIRAELVKAQGRIKATGADLKLVEPENVHLTLKFLGEVGEEMIGRISETMERSVPKGGAFKAGVRGVGVFPDLRYIRVVWAGVSDGADRIVELQRGIDAGMESLGFKRESGFVPHITLARVRSPRGRERLIDELRAMSDLDFGTMEVKSVKLRQSRLTPQGPIYSTIAEACL
ncbi:MAG: RNA 2',3'-cyclic phosphodiesterase [Candidatus Hadarchaeales archaeon]